MMRKILHRVKAEKEERKKKKEAIDIQIHKNEGKQIKFYNFWEQPYEDMFWYRFLMARPQLLNNSVKFGFFSVFGDRILINQVDTDVNFFYTAENVKVDNYVNYADHFLSSERVDLALGYEYFEHERYIRFPNWMDVFFLKTEEISDVCRKLRFPPIDNKDRFASCIASHGGKGMRDSIVDALNVIEEVSCPGRFRHNDDSLLRQFGDNKVEYLKWFNFNICPENSNCMGYVTEKIFHAISVGCIPIYWGSYNRPELEVLNQDAIIFWNKDGDNSNVVKLIKDLYESPKLMKEFLAQPRLISTAEEYMMDTFLKIEHKMNQLVIK